MQKSELLICVGKHWPCTTCPAEQEPRKVVLLLMQNLTLWKHVPWVLAGHVPFMHCDQRNLVTTLLNQGKPDSP